MPPRVRAAAPEPHPAKPVRRAGPAPARVARRAAPGSSAHVLEMQQAAGNSAVRRAVVASVVRERTGGGDLRRLWDKKTFSGRTYEGYFTQKSMAQKTVETLLAQYHGTGLKDDKHTAAHANLLAQLKRAAELWIEDHTVTDEEGTKEDPNRQKRMAGMKDFLTNVGAEFDLVKGELGDEFSPEIGEEHKAFTKLRDHYQGSANSLFVKAAKAIDLAVSNIGDAAELEIEFEIPIDPEAVGFIGGRLSVEAEKTDEGMTKVRTEMVVTGGVNVGVAKLKAELGGYIEAQAASSADAMNLYSYGLYRRFRESDAIPHGATDYLWGGQAGSYGKKKSEAWSRDLETRLFGAVPDPDPNDPKYEGLSPSAKKSAYEGDLAEVEKARERVKNTYVETGGVVAGKGEVGLEGILEAEVGVKYTTGRKITAETLKAAKGGAGKKNIEGWIGGQKKLGESVSSKELASSFTVGPFTGGITVSSSGGELEIEITGEGAIPAGALDGVVSYLADTAITGIKMVRTLDEHKDETVGPLVAIGSFQKSLFAPVQADLTGKSLGDVVGDVGVRGVVTVTRDAEGNWGGSLELRHFKALDKNLPKFVSVKAEMSERLVKWTYGGGGWS